jgi:hypothetical protein
MEKIKGDISRKEGERAATENSLQKEFRFLTLNEAYDKFDGLKQEVESRKEEKTSLTNKVTEELAKYGY